MNLPLRQSLLTGKTGASELLRGVRSLAKRYLGAYPRLYTQVKWLEARFRYTIAVPHERDFNIFRRLPASGLFVDIGANIGQSAFSFDSVRPGWNILSFEPNPGLAKCLELTSRAIGKRHSYTIMGLGAKRGDLPFYVPHFNGLEATQEGTFCREELLDAATQARLGPGWDVNSILVPVERFDNLGLAPDIVKIDVQGFEYEVLAGMEQTLRNNGPKILYVEAGPRTTAVTQFLSSFGYTPSSVDGGRLQPWKAGNTLNVIYSRVQ